MSDFERVCEVLYLLLNSTCTGIKTNKESEIISVNIDCFGKFDLIVKNIDLLEVE